MTDDIAAKVERHERLLYGIDDGHVGMKAKVVELERFIAELKAERKEASEDRRRIMSGLVVAILLQLVALVYAIAAHLGV